MLKNFILKTLTVMIIATCVFGISGCKKKTWSYNSETNKEAAKAHVPFAGVKDTGAEYDLPKMVSPYKVIDVSAWQGKIDFKAVADSGVKGVIIRLARYNSDKDEYFDRNYTEAKKNGLMVGCYFFMGAQTTDSAQQEAEKVTGLLNENKYELELPVFYDVENDHGDDVGAISSLDKQLLTDIIKTFCETMKKNGYYAGYYSNVKFAHGEYYPEQLRAYPYWVARWSDNNTCVMPYYVWQYSCTGKVPGIEGDCDLDLCFADFYTYIKDRGYNNLKK